MPPQTLLQRVSRLVSDTMTKPETDIHKRWQSIVDDGPGAECVAELGPIPDATLFDVDTDTAIQYSAADADATLRVNSALDPQIDALGLRPALELDYSVVPMLVSMMENGLLVDREHLSVLGDIFSETLLDLERRCHTLAGHPFLVSSADQVATVLFDELRLRGGRLTPKKTRYSTDDKTLEMLKGQHPIIALLQEHREVSKLQHSYVEVLPGLIDDDGRWRYELGMTTIPSGRLNGWGGVNPLGIPTRTELGREIRRCFIAPEGRLLGAVDLNQIELRGLAVLSQDEHLLQAYSEGADLHALTAAEAIFHVPLQEVTYEQRQRGKTTNFAVANQISALGLRDQFYLSGILDLDEVDCQRYLDGWYNRYRAVRPWYGNVYSDGRQHGFVRCPLSARILWCPGLRSSIDKVRAQAERVSTNFLLQCYASTIGKHGMAAIWEWLQSDNLCDPLLWVHDEFLCEFDADRAEDAETVLMELMTGTDIARRQPIPILAGWHCGENWAECK